MTKYRDRLGIIADILEVARDGAKKTRIMYMANLSYTLLTRYMSDVLDRGLVKKETGKTYMLTDKGAYFLQKINSYRKRQEEIEEQLSDIKNEGATLIDTFLKDHNE